MFKVLKVVSFAYRGYIYLIINTVNYIILDYITTIVIILKRNLFL